MYVTAQRLAVGRRGHHGAQLRRHHASRRSGTRKSPPRRLKTYDWLHLHHEDFTGQYSKFFLNYSGAPWLADMVQRNQATATAARLPQCAGGEAGGSSGDPGIRGSRRFPLRDVHRDRDARPGARPVPTRDIAASYADGTPMDPDAASHMRLEPDARLPECAAGAEPQIVPALLRHRRPPGQLPGAPPAARAPSSCSASAPRSIRWPRCWCRTIAT